MANAEGINLPEGFSLIDDTPQNININLPEGFELIREQPEREIAPGSASFGTRALASLPVTGEGEINILKQKLGEDNVFTDQAGDIFVREKGKNAFVRLDPKGFDIGDITADAPGTLMDIAGGIVGGIAGAATPATPLGGAAIGAGIARSGRQGLAEFLGADEPLTAGERIKDVGITSATELAGGAAGAAIGAAFKGLKNTVFSTLLNQSKDSPVFKQRAAIEEVTQIPFTRAERSGKTGLLTLEGEIRRNPKTADIAQSFDALRLDKARQLVDSKVDKLNASNVSLPSVASDISNAFNSGVQKAARLRTKQGNADFGLVDDLAGKEPIIAASNFESILKDELAQADIGKFFTETGAIKSTNLEKMLQSVQKGGKLTGGETQAILHKLSQVQRGKDSFFKDLPNREQIGLASRLRSALEADLDNAVEAGGLAGDVSSALRTARQNWRANTEAINEFGNQTISQVLKVSNPDPDKIAKKLLTLTPTEISRARKIIEPASPGVFERAGGAVINDFLEQSASAAPTTLLTKQGEQGISFATFSTLWNKNSQKLKQMLPEKVFDDMETISQQFRILADAAGTKGSPTQPLQQAGQVLDVSADVLTSPAGGASQIKQLAKGVPRDLLKIMARRKVAGIVFGDDVARGALKDALVGGSPASVMRNFGIVSAILAKESSE